MKRFGGIIISLCGSILIVPGVVLHTICNIYAQYRYPLIGIPLSLMGKLIIVAGRAVHVEGKKLSIIPAEQLLAMDKRPPVLYLRSFELERLTASEAAMRSSSNKYLPYAVNLQTQEEILSQVLKRVGPCVTVGDPRNKGIVLGFSRLRLGDDWKERVSGLIEQSAIVVHCAGGTPGLLWELEQVATTVVPRSKLLLLVTPTITEEWWELADRLFGGVPRFAVSSEEQQPYAAIIYFDKTGKLHSDLILGFDRPPRVVLEEALDPVLHQLNVQPRGKLLRWLSNPLHWPLLAFLSLVFFIFVVIIASEPIFPVKRTDTPMVAEQPVQSLFTGAKWSTFRPPDSPFTVEIPGEQVEIDVSRLPALLPETRKRALYQAQYKWYDTNIFIDRYIFSRESSIDLKAVVERMPTTYKNEFVKSLSIDTVQNMDSALSIAGSVQVKIINLGGGQAAPRIGSYAYRAAIAIKGREAFFVSVMFKADSQRGEADASENVQRIINSIKSQ